MDEKNIIENIKNITETAYIFKRLFEPRGVDTALEEAQKKIIEDVVTSEKYSLDDKILFVANYKKIMREYKNCKLIAEKAKYDILPESDIEKVDSDWFAFFFEKAKLVSDEAMQKIWATILSEEINTPNSINRSLIHTLSIINKRQAEIFCELCRFCWFDLEYDKVHPFIYIAKETTAYADSKITWNMLKDFEYLGLINCENNPGYMLKGSRQFRTGNIIVKVTPNDKNNNYIDVGNVVFTYNGRKLYDLIDYEYKRYRNDIFSFIENMLIKNGCSVDSRNVARNY